jgi:Opioid growth factor receptor (OGFr) conserved region
VAQAPNRVPATCGENSPARFVTSPKIRVAPERDTPIIAFYRGVGLDHRGRSLTHLQEQSLADLESVHDYIQWLFPLTEASSASKDAPILIREDILSFRKSLELREQLERSLLTMLAFYGLERRVPTGQPLVVRGPTFAVRATVWISPSNHNFLRLTRILRCLAILGLREESRALLTCLMGIQTEFGHVIGERTLRYWRDAVDHGPSE